MIAESLMAKVEEQIERMTHLIGMLPEGAEGWAPPVAGGWTAGMLMGHLLDCLAGFCAVFQAAFPERLAHFEELRRLPVNRARTAGEALEAIAVYRERIREGGEVLQDADLARRLPTVFVPAGETVTTLLLGNLEHLVNHKFQLFTYLKMMGAPVGTADLYRFRR